MKLILVHGRAQEDKNPEILKNEWLEAFDRGLEKHSLKRPEHLDVILPYYGDELAKLIAKIETEEIQGYRLRGEQPETDEMAFRAAVLAEMANAKGITQEAIDLEYRGDPRQRGIANWGWVQAIARAIDAAHFGDGGVELFTRDVYLYLRNPNVKRAVDEIVRRAFSEGPCVVVGHSLGSIVAYNVLRTLKSDSVIERYITVGSPLGINAIRDRIPTPIEMPAHTKSWFNARDPRDVVALYPLTKENFPVDPAIENFDGVKNGTDNRHGIDGYLDDKLVAKRVYDSLT